MLTEKSSIKGWHFPSVPCAESISNKLSGTIESTKRMSASKRRPEDIHFLSIVMVFIHGMEALLVKESGKRREDTD